MKPHIDIRHCASYGCSIAMKKKVLQRTMMVPCMCLVLGLRAQNNAGYKAHIKELQQIIDTRLRDSVRGLYYESDSSVNENPHCWLWPLCAYVQAANEREVVDKGRSYMPVVEKAIDQYYDDRAPAPAYQDYVRSERASSRFYDDNQWVAIAYLDAYNRTHVKRYLQKALMIYRFMLTGLDTAAGGGLYWKEGDHTTKNTCSNGPGILIALQLYRITRQQGYLDTALLLYHWVNQHLQSPEGIYYDNIKIPSGRIARAMYTYNTGTMLQSNVLLYELTKQPDYLREAQRIAVAAKVQFVKGGRLPHNYWFNAVLLRGCQELYHVDHDRGWLDIFQADADAVWEMERDAVRGVGPKSPKRLIDQAAMIEIYARLIEEGVK